ncbi:MAG TPA: DNA polymerase III subunit gamma/tau [Longimicrobiales bacterium]|nr:DNA polymerase III subunit gamma/tau [Longimicrobiales bacterium]
MSRTALARTYRPRTFAELAMQDHVAETLRSAIVGERVAHAYLFSGPRGVGKTTAARVLAMALNCADRTAEGEPCGVCDSCERIWSGKASLDVVEIDAASNRGVDDARDLRERAMYAPSDVDRYKVYIIDEAHMLTREAWNALLKILEEPPPRVIFVFATTEPQKIQQAAPPILSRCQRFDFRRMSVQAIVDRLQVVLEAEGTSVPEEALIPLARRAEGGMRDALSLLDQVLALAGDALAADDVTRVLGIPGDALYVEALDIIANRRHGDVFGFVRRLLDEGFDPSEFQRGFAEALRDALAIKLDGAATVDLRADALAELTERAERFGAADLLRMLAQVAELDVDGRFRKSANPRLLLESLLLRLTHLDRTVDLETLLRAAGEGSLEGLGAPWAGAGGAAEADPPSTAAAPADAGDATGPPTRPPEESATAAGTVGSGGAAEAGARASAVGAAGIGPDPLGAARAALAEITRVGGDLPPGLAALMRAASVVAVEEDAVRLEVPAGPARERLEADPVARRTMEAKLTEALGSPTRVRLASETGGVGVSPGERLTAEALKERQIQRLVAEEPALARAVEELDLELLD